MKVPARTNFPVPRVGPTHRLNRMAEKRNDGDWLAARMADPASRFLLFSDLSLAITSNEDRSETSIRWYNADALAALGADLSGALLIGCGEDGHAIFALSLSVADTAALPGGQKGTEAAGRSALPGHARHSDARRTLNRRIGACARRLAYDATLLRALRWSLQGV